MWAPSSPWQARRWWRSFSSERSVWRSRLAAITLVVNSLEGYWLMPWLSSRASRMNAVVVFGGLLFWGWLWGGWGLVLGLPIMMVIKAICDHVEDFKPIGEFMAE